MILAQINSILASPANNLAPLALFLSEVDRIAASWTLDDRSIIMALNNVRQYRQVQLRVVLEHGVRPSVLSYASPIDEVFHLLLEPFEQARPVEDMQFDKILAQLRFSRDVLVTENDCQLGGLVLLRHCQVLLTDRTNVVAK